MQNSRVNNNKCLHKNLKARSNLLKSFIYFLKIPCSYFKEKIIPKVFTFWNNLFFEKIFSILKLSKMNITLNYIQYFNTWIKCFHMCNFFDVFLNFNSFQFPLLNWSNEIRKTILMKMDFFSSRFINTLSVFSFGYLIFSIKHYLRNENTSVRFFISPIQAESNLWIYFIFK